MLIHGNVLSMLIVNSSLSGRRSLIRLSAWYRDLSMSHPGQPGQVAGSVEFGTLHILIGKKYPLRRHRPPIFAAAIQIQGLFRAFLRRRSMIQSSPPTPCVFTPSPCGSRNPCQAPFAVPWIRFKVAIDFLMVDRISWEIVYFQIKSAVERRVSCSQEHYFPR